jgi:non-heme chloroperoxidase
MLVSMQAPQTPDRRSLRHILVPSLLALALMPTLTTPASAQTAAVGQHRYISARDGLPLCVFETGNPAGRELLLVHGFSQSYAVFKRQYQGPLAKDFRIVAFDLRGHGCSGKAWDPAAYVDTRRWADDVATVIDDRKLNRPLFVGWSYGGYVAADYVRHHGTRRLAGIVMIGSNAGLLPLDAPAKERSDAARAASRTLAPDVEAQIAAGNGFVNVMTANPAPPDMREIMFATNQMMPPYVRRAFADRSLDNSDIVDRFDLPVWLLAGSKDLSQPEALLRAVASRLPQAKLVLMEGTGHAPFIDQPAAFDTELRRIVEATANRLAAAPAQTR